MANYKETTVAGTSYVRAREVHIDNPLGGPGKVQFMEEKVLNLDGSVAVVPNPGLDFLAESFTPDNVATSFAMMGPDGTPTGATATYQDVYNTLFSLYYHLALRRDHQGQP